VIFEHALRKLGTPAAETLHVGDSAAEDLAGARAAGMQALLINRQGNAGPDSIKSLTDLLSLVPAFA